MRVELRAAVVEESVLRQVVEVEIISRVVLHADNLPLTSYVLAERLNYLVAVSCLRSLIGAWAWF